MSQVQAIVDHHHPGHPDGVRTTISKVRFVDPTKPEENDKDESNEVNLHEFMFFGDCAVVMSVAIVVDSNDLKK